MDDYTGTHLSGGTDSTRQYLRDIGRIKMLTHPEEIEYGKQVRRWIDLQTEIEPHGTVSDTALKEHDLTREQWQKIAKIGDRAKRKMVEANLRLVVSIAKKYTERGVTLLDLIQEGNIGMIRAVEKYDPTMGYKFSTYAYWWVRQGITRAISQQARVIRLPVHMVEKINKIKQTRHQLSQELGRSVTIEEIADRLDSTADSVRELLRNGVQAMSLDATIGSDRDTTLGEMLEDSGQNPDAFLSQVEIEQAVDYALSQLPERDRQIIELRAGMSGSKPMSLAQVGSVLGVSRERVRQKEQGARAKMRNRIKRSRFDRAMLH